MLFARSSRQGDMAFFDWVMYRSKRPGLGRKFIRRVAQSLVARGDRWHAANLYRKLREGL